MLRKFACIAVLGLAACAPGVPNNATSFDGRPADIGTGVGFGSYDSYEASRVAREQDLRNGAAGQSAVAAAPVISSEELRRAGLPGGNGAGGGLPAVDSVGSGEPLSATGPAAAIGPSSEPVSTNNSGISDEQSFEAVSSRESIESDAQRLARQAQAYQVIQPTAVPTRRGSGGPNIVAYALSSSNERGQPIYNRGGIALESRSIRACNGYPSPDLAQEAFLERGGPERDRLNLDPDGDGFACAWDPAPFRAARG